MVEKNNKRGTDLVDNFSDMARWGFISPKVYDAAFISWLLNSFNRPEESDIKRAAILFLDLIFKDDKPENYESVEITCDYQNIPIIVEVNHTQIIVIETGILDINLLKKAVNEKKLLRNGNLPAFPQRREKVKIALLDVRYRETGIGIDNSYDSIDTIISAEELLGCLSFYPLPNIQFYLNYYTDLSNFCAKAATYKNRKLENWDQFSYYGFFSMLEKKFPQDGTGWGYKQKVYGLQRWFCWNVVFPRNSIIKECPDFLARLYFEIEIVDNICELCVNCKAAPQKRVPTSFLWEVCNAFIKAFQEQGISCKKKRFLGGTITPVCAIAFDPTKWEKTIDIANIVYQEAVSQIL